MKDKSISSVNENLILNNTLTISPFSGISRMSLYAKRPLFKSKNAYERNLLDNIKNALLKGQNKIFQTFWNKLHTRHKKSADFLSFFYSILSQLFSLFRK